MCPAPEHFHVRKSVCYSFITSGAFGCATAEVVAVVGPVQLFAQFWYHTNISGDQVLENIIGRPSTTVHHAINKRYLDKIFPQIALYGINSLVLSNKIKEVPLSIWRYRPVRHWNPVKGINFQHLWLLMQDAWQNRKLERKVYPLVPGARVTALLM